MKPINVDDLDDINNDKEIMEAPSKVSIVAARGLHNEIGRGNQLLWRMPGDLKRFRETTIGKPIIMGRKTYLSIGKPLPERQNIIITRDLHFTAPGCEVVHSLEASLRVAANYGKEAMIIGGEQIFLQAIPICDTMYLTTLQAKFPEADTFLPTFIEGQWEVISRQDFAADEKNPYACCLEVYVRRKEEGHSLQESP
jgi:dihydrofolate reductase